MDVSEELKTLLTNEIFIKLINSEKAQIAQFNAAIALLIKLGISFDVSFLENTRVAPAKAELTIFLNSTATVTTSVQFVIRFDR